MTNQELIALVKKNPISVSCGLVALVCGLGIYFRSDGLPDAEKLLEEKSAEGERLALNLSNSTLLNEQLSAIASAAREIDSRLVRHGELAKNLQYFYKLEAVTGVKLIDLHQNLPATPKSGAKPTSYTGIGYVIILEGEYPALVEFLRQMETGLHFSRVITANITGSKAERGSSLKLALTVELLGLP